VSLGILVVLCLQLLLIGTECGLFAMQFANDADHRPLTCVAGIDGIVHAVDGHADPGLLFCIVGMCAHCGLCQHLLNS